MILRGEKVSFKINYLLFYDHLEIDTSHIDQIKTHLIQINRWNVEGTKS